MGIAVATQSDRGTGNGQDLFRDDYEDHQQCERDAPDQKDLVKENCTVDTEVEADVPRKVGGCDGNNDSGADSRIDVFESGEFHGYSKYRVTAG